MTVKKCLWICGGIIWIFLLEAGLLWTRQPELSRMSGELAMSDDMTCYLADNEEKVPVVYEVDEAGKILKSFRDPKKGSKEGELQNLTWTDQGLCYLKREEIRKTGQERKEIYGVYRCLEQKSQVRRIGELEAEAGSRLTEMTEEAGSLWVTALSKTGDTAWVYELEVGETKNGSGAEGNKEEGNGIEGSEAVGNGEESNEGGESGGNSSGKTENIVNGKLVQTIWAPEDIYFTDAAYTESAVRLLTDSGKVLTGNADMWISGGNVPADSGEPLTLEASGLAEETLPEGQKAVWLESTRGGILFKTYPAGTVYALDEKNTEITKESAPILAIDAMSKKASWTIQRENDKTVALNLSRSKKEFSSSRIFMDWKEYLSMERIPMLIVGGIGAAAFLLLSLLVLAAAGRRPIWVKAAASLLLVQLAAGTVLGAFWNIREQEQKEQQISSLARVYQSRAAEYLETFLPRNVEGAEGYKELRTALQSQEGAGQFQAGSGRNGAGQLQAGQNSSGQSGAGQQDGQASSGQNGAGQQASQDSSGQSGAGQQASQDSSGQSGVWQESAFKIFSSVIRGKDLENQEKAYVIASAAHAYGYDLYEMVPAEVTEAVARAASEGTAQSVSLSRDFGHVFLVLPLGERMIPDTFLITELEEGDPPESFGIGQYGVWLWILADFLVLLLVCCWHFGRVGRFAKAVEKLTEGKEEKKPKGNSSEMERSWKAVQKLLALEERGRYEAAGRVSAYSRFIPERFPELMEKSGIEEIAAGEVKQVSGSFLQIYLGDLNGDGTEAEPGGLSFIDRLGRLLCLFGQEKKANAGTWFPDGSNLGSVRVVYEGEAKAFVQEAIGVWRRMNGVRDLAGQINPMFLLYQGACTCGLAGSPGQVFPFAVSREMEKMKETARIFREKKVRMAVTEELLGDLQPGQEYRYLGYLMEGGKEYRFYEILEVYPREEQQKRRITKEKFEKALELFYQNDFYLARLTFAQVLKECPGDRMAVWYLFACERMFQNTEGDISHELFAGEAFREKNEAGGRP